MRAGEPKDKPATRGPSPTSLSLWNFFCKMESRRGTVEPEAEHLQPFFVCPCMLRWVNTSSVKVEMWKICPNLRTSLNWADLPRACSILLWIISRALKTDRGASENGTVLASPPTYYSASLANYRILIDYNIYLVWFSRLECMIRSLDYVRSWEDKTHYSERNNWSTKHHDLCIIATHQTQTWIN